MALDILDKSYGPCCWNKNPKYKKYDSIEKYIGSPELKELKEYFANDKQHSSCNKCWDLEQKGLTSMRQSILQDRKDADISKISQVKLHTGRTCNFACMMCFPTVSSTWDNLWNEKNYPEIFSKSSGHEQYDVNAETYIKDNIEDIRYIEILGGEPFFNKRLIKLLDWIIDKNCADKITLYTITNGSLITDTFKKRLQQFKKVVLTISLEGVGPVNDYIRWGSDWKTLDRNIKLNRNMFDIGILPTVSALNIHRLHELEEYCQQEKLMLLNPGPVTGWNSLNPINSPLQNLITPRYRKYIDQKQKVGDLKKFITAWDEQRKISILDYMPEWEEFLNGQSR